LKRAISITVFGLGFLVLGPLEELQAIVGRPLTPLSVAGVARRTARRTVRRRTTAVVATTVVVVAPTVVTTTVVATPVLAVGTAVAALPSGCTNMAVGGLTYYQCGGVYYQPSYSGPNLVYVVAMPPQ